MSKNDYVDSISAVQCKKAVSPNFGENHLLADLNTTQSDKNSEYKIKLIIQNCTQIGTIHKGSNSLPFMAIQCIKAVFSFTKHKGRKLREIDGAI